MKYIAFLLALFMPLGAVWAQQGAPVMPPVAIISGQIQNPPTTKAIVIVKPNPFTNEQLTYEGALDAQGRFSIKTDFPLGIEAMFQCGQAQAMLFVEPGDSLYMQGNATDWINSLKYSGKPQSAQQNEYLRQFYLTYKDKNIDFADPNKVRTLEPANYRLYCDSLRTVMTNFYDQSKTGKTLSPFFEVYAKAQIDYDYAMALLEHPSQYARAKGLQTFNIPQDYYSFFNTFPVNNNFAIFTPIYHQFVDMFVSEFFAQQVINATPNYDMQGYYADRYEFAKKFLQGEALNFALTKSVVDGATRGSVEKVLDKYEDFKKTNTRNEYLQVFELLRKQFTPISAGQVAPDFTAYDLNGQPIKLSSLKGKVVYIDFWATWCGPCRQQFPAERELHKKFEGNKDVVFLLVSTDSKPEPWKAFLDKEKLPGTNVWAGDQYAAVANTYNITGIPRFMLIDKQGKIFSSNARRPADTRIEADIRALLQ